MTPHQCKYIAYDLSRKTMVGQDRLIKENFPRPLSDCMEV